jgi:hypothetical protein
VHRQQLGLKRLHDPRPIAQLMKLQVREQLEDPIRRWSGAVALLRIQGKLGDPGALHGSPDLTLDQCMDNRRHELQEQKRFDATDVLFSCVCPKSGTQREIAYGGFERDRMTVKYRCPAQHYGYHCAGAGCCELGKAVRIPLDEDRRVFTPLPRSSLKWERCYDRRTAVERVNSRLDVNFGFERHTIRGLTKMSTRCCLALAVMLAMAVGRIKANQAESMRSLLKAA